MLALLGIGKGSLYHGPIVTRHAGAVWMWEWISIPGPQHQKPGHTSTSHAVAVWIWGRISLPWPQHQKLGHIVTRHAGAVWNWGKDLYTMGPTPEASWVPFGVADQRLLGYLLESLDMILGRLLEPIMKPLGDSWGPFGGFLGPLLGLLWTSWRPAGGLGGLLGLLGGLLGPPGRFFRRKTGTFES